MQESSSDKEQDCDRSHSSSTSYRRRPSSSMSNSSSSYSTSRGRSDATPAPRAGATSNTSTTSTTNNRSTTNKHTSNKASTPNSTSGMELGKCRSDTVHAFNSDQKNDKSGGGGDKTRRTNEDAEGESHEEEVSCARGSSINEHRQHRQQQPEQHVLQTHPHHSYYEQHQHQQHHHHYYPHLPQPQQHDLYHDEDSHQHQMHRPWQNMYNQSQQIREIQEEADLLHSLRNSDIRFGTRNDEQSCFYSIVAVITAPANLIQIIDSPHQHFDPMMDPSNFFIPTMSTDVQTSSTFPPNNAFQDTCCTSNTKGIDIEKCSKYVSRVKMRLLALDREEDFDRFLQVLGSWKVEGLSCEDVLFEMRRILQEASEEDLLDEFVSFLPSDAQEEARLEIVAARISQRENESSERSG